MNYKEHYKAFSQNIEFAARTWYHHVYLQNTSAQDAELLNFLNRAPRFWLDQRYSAVQTTIIFLGKVFDTDGKSTNIDKTILAVRNEKSYFSKEELRKRKVQSAGEFDGIDDYINSASELDDDDIKEISLQIRKAKVIWRKLKPLRDKVYAHNEMLSDSERGDLYKAVKNQDIIDIIQILLNVSDALLEAEINGKKPDFLNNHTKPIDWAKNDIDDLVNSLLQR